MSHVPLAVLALFAGPQDGCSNTSRDLKRSRQTGLPRLFCLIGAVVPLYGEPWVDAAPQSVIARLWFR